jgi:uncharacterized protein YlbG (UPF0298 family)
MSHNANEVLRSSRKLHSDLTAASLQSCKMAAREVQLAIRDNLPQHHTGAGKFEGYAATGALRRAVSVTAPRKTRQGFEAEVYMMPDKTKPYQSIHEYGGIIRARRKPYLVFKVKGQWVRTKQVRIRQKRYWRSVKPSDVAVKIQQRTEALVRAIR